jgi:hypothetical protein
VKRTIYEDAWLTVTLDEPNGIVRYVRSSRPFVSVEDVVELHAKIGELLHEGAARKLGILIDVREAPLRNDASFEATLVGSFEPVMARFIARAILVKSAMGRLQTTRLSRERGRDVEVFSTEEEALGYLAQKAAARRRPK